MSSDPYPPVPPNEMPSGYPPPARTMRNRKLALAVEIGGALFGLFGLGWIYAGNTAFGFVLLLAGLAWVGISLFVGALTVGISCLFTVPITLVVIVVNAVMLNKYIDQHPELFGE